MALFRVLISYRAKVDPSRLRKSEIIARIGTTRHNGLLPKPSDEESGWDSHKSQRQQDDVPCKDSDNKDHENSQKSKK